MILLIFLKNILNCLKNILNRTKKYLCIFFPDKQLLLLQSFFSKVADMVQGADLPQTDTHWISESGIIDVFLLFGPKPRDVFKQYAVLTGTTPLPPVSHMHQLSLVFSLAI